MFRHRKIFHNDNSIVMTSTALRTQSTYAILSSPISVLLQAANSKSVIYNN